MTEQGAGLIVPRNEPTFSRCALLLRASDCLRFPSPDIKTPGWQSAYKAGR